MSKEKTNTVLAEQDKKMLWKVNTPQLLKEIAQFTKEGGSLRIPISVFGLLLAEVGERAAELNDDKLNALMCRLAIYEIADPYNPNYNKELNDATIAKG